LGHFYFRKFFWKFTPRFGATFLPRLRFYINFDK
jgi:hypothetical protein